MKIIFICGSLELGRDGVGDYVRLLAKELQDKGHQPAAIALRDAHIEQNHHKIWVKDNNLWTLRLPACWPEYLRLQCAKNNIDKFQPDWLSIQFVPYAFHSKGLPISLVWHLKSIVRGKRVHLMMHETWVGAEFGATMKRQLLSFIQKSVIKTIITNLAPAVIHTHLPIYRNSLQRLGWTVLPLPLFSNIPVSSAIPVLLEPGIFRIGIFSQISKSSRLIDFLTKLVTHIDYQNLKYKILLIGGHVDKMQEFKNYLESNINLHMRVDYTGFLDPVQLSTAIQTCHLGLTSVPQHGLGKSGTVAAFLAHGIPVAAPISFSMKNTLVESFFSEDLNNCIISEPDLIKVTEAQGSIHAAKMAIQLPTIASTFIEDLSKA